MPKENIAVHHNWVLLISPLGHPHLADYNLSPQQCEILSQFVETERHITTTSLSIFNSSPKVRQQLKQSLQLSVCQLMALFRQSGMAKNVCAVFAGSTVELSLCTGFCQMQFSIAVYCQMVWG